METNLIMRRQWMRLAAALPLLLAGVLAWQAQDEGTFARQREQMVDYQLASSRGGLADPVRDKRVLEVMGKVPRHLFVPADVAQHAYGDHPLPIGHRQTISQPYMVAKMTEIVEPKPNHRVLEIGTGSGYQAAVLAELVAEVYTIEIVEPLGTEARKRLAELGYKNVQVRIGDGYAGWPEAAPFDCVVVTAGAKEVPPALIQQLKPGGRMVIPVGSSPTLQKLLLVTKDSKAPYEVRKQELMHVAFVPFVRGADQP
jgi:protein-L-isoaspartate(D-aspartate) O-methyltransferase